MRKHLLLILMSLLPMLATAYTAEINGIYYVLYGNDEAEVTYQQYQDGRYYSDYSGAVTIPRTVTYFGRTFTVTKIGFHAFSGCAHLTSVTIPNSVTRIYDEAFLSCESLTSITIPNSVTHLGNWVFWHCKNLTSITIPNSVTSIGEKAFWACISLTTVTIGNGVTSIGKNTFESCSNLTSATIIGNGVTSIGEEVFLNCEKLTSITIGNGVASIGEKAFYGCKNLTSITIGCGVTSIGKKAFEGCKSLTAVHIKDLGAWCKISFNGIDANPLSYAHHLFMNGKEIKELTFPESVTSISEIAFNECTGLNSIVFHENMTNIGDGAFHSCYGLASVTIRSSVLSIHSGAFRSCMPSKVIYLTNTPPDGYQYVNGSKNYVANDQYSNLSRTPEVYPYLSSMFEVDGIKYVPVSPSERTCDAIDCAYSESAENINLEETVTYRGITLTVRQRGRFLCRNNTFIKHVNLKFNGAVDGSAFIGCTALQNAELGQGITSIGSNVFGDCSKLESITIPDSVVSIGTSAFSGCSAMTSVTLGNGVEKIDDYAFSGCSSLPTIQIPQNVTTIGNSVFNNCSNLKTVLIDDGKAELNLGSNGSNPLFASCPLDSVYIGRNITYPTDSVKGYSPFFSNTTLRSVTIAGNETEISANEFYGCTNLKDVRTGNKMMDVGDWAFSGCSSLRDVVLGINIKTIGKEAFSGCKAMTSLISKATIPPVCASYALDDINKWDCTLIVPQDNITAYQQADQWKEFFFIEGREFEDAIKGLKSENIKEVDYYDLNSRRLAAPQKGINIIRYSDGTSKKVLVK